MMLKGNGDDDVIVSDHYSPPFEHLRDVTCLFPSTSFHDALQGADTEYFHFYKYNLTL